MNNPKHSHPMPPSLSPELKMLEDMDAISRRRFLSLLSASTALALGVSCSKIDRGAIVPYTKRPGAIIPGVAACYASTFQEGINTCNVLVNTREGRPIHIEGNAEASGPFGKASLRAMGDLLGLYDPDRLRAPIFKGTQASWDDAMKALARALSDARLMDRNVLLLTGAIISPTQRALLYDLKLALPNLHHAAWEPCADQNELRALESFYGEAQSTCPHFERAEVILSLQSDFLGTSSGAPDFIQGFSSRRKISRPEERMNRLWVFEGGMSLTGANADERLQMRPSQMASLAFAMARFLNEVYAVPLPDGLVANDLKSFDLEKTAQTCRVPASVLKLLAADLQKAKSSALIVAGAALPPEAHVACHLLNTMLGSVANTVDLERNASNLLTLQQLQDLFKEASAGKFAVGVFWNANPAYAFPDNSLWKRAVARIPETYRIGLHEDETALDCAWRLPEHHWLEAWGDFESGSGFVGLRQPAIGALHDTRQAEDIFISSLRSLKIRTSRNYYEYLKSRWRLDLYPIGSPASFETFWNASLHDGGIRRAQTPEAPPKINIDAIRKALMPAAQKRSLNPSVELAPTLSPGTPIRVELILSPGAGVYDGRYANNGWLQELPDPVTKATWGNPVRLSPLDASRLGLKDEDVVIVSNGIERLESAVIIQPGQASGVLEIALGYGRRTGNIARAVGSNAFPLMRTDSPFFIRGATIQGAENGKRLTIPRRQTHSRMEGRNLSRSWTMAEFSRNLGDKKPEEKNHAASLIPEREYPGHKWGMVIDLSACVGCSACVIACQSENNIPVVGPEQVNLGREMHWIRIDRYYEGDLQNPQVRHQPMLCQQCDNAPCEIVCPVNATTHSPDGLNQMTYNRCVGTRYCSNNCPFKVRRFNFLDYTSMKKEPEILVHNPEVTVRPRGVMEKCTFCIQRIQNARQQARSEGREVRDGEIQPACAAACPADAIVFGDMNDKQSRVAVLSRMGRGYRLLEDLGIKPSITYLVDIANPVPLKGKA